MKTSLLILTLLAAPALAGAAVDPAASNKPATPPVHHDAAYSKAQMKAATERGALMSACQKKSADQNLYQVERQQFLAACMAGK